MKPIIPAAALFALMLLALPSVAQDAPKPAAETVHIGPKWKVGDVTRQKIVTENKSETNHPTAGKSTTTIATTMVAVETVKSIDDKGNVATEMFYESIIAKQKSPQASIDWDSTKPGENDNQGVAIYKVMLKHKYALKYDNSGKVIEANGFDPMLEEFFKVIEDERTREMLRGTLMPVMGDKAMLRTLGSGQFFPGKQVAKGDTWDVKSEIVFPMGSGKIDASMKFKLEGLEPGKDGQLAQISGTGDMKLSKAGGDEKKDNEEGGQDRPKGMFDMFDITVENGKHRVDVVFNIDRGLVVKQVNKQTFDTTMSLKGGNVTITQEVVNTTTIELLPPKAAEPEKPAPRKDEK